MTTGDWVSLPVQAKLTQQERTFEQTIRKLSSRLEVEEEQFARTSGHLRLDLAEKDDQLKVRSIMVIYLQCCCPCWCIPHRNFHIVKCSCQHCVM